MFSSAFPVWLWILPARGDPDLLRVRWAADRTREWFAVNDRLPFEFWVKQSDDVIQSARGLILRVGLIWRFAWTHAALPPFC